MSEKIEIEVVSNTAKALKSAKELSAEYKNAGDLASRIASKVPQGGASGGGNKEKIRNYDEFRGSVGTGAASRDFAKQASGLGGLVHVYATFAANIFAITAAFTALSKAADTTNMVKGLGQLGAASGRDLVGLSKQLVAAADGAVSLKEALTATAAASAGGMGGDQLLRLTAVAKNASQALGRDMPDALSRLTRGITKIEPELLDELGILVKVDTANQNYARNLGKTVSSLTDLERRQAFANEAISQGEKKFGAISMASNPYSKILASTTDLIQQGLELVNKVVGPLVEMLSKSPTGLAVAIGAIASVLLKQAIPAIGSMRENLRAAAEQSTQLAAQRAIDAKASTIAAVQAANMESEAVAVARLSKVEETENKIRKLKVGKATAALINKPLHELTDDDLGRVESNAAMLRSKGLTESADIHARYAKELREHRDSELAYAASVEKGNKTIDARASYLNTAGRAQVIANRALLQSVTSSITSTAAETGATSGLRAAIAEARVAIAKAKQTGNTMETGREIDSVDALGNAIKVMETTAVPAMGKVRAQFTMFRAVVSGATGAIGTMMNALGPWMFVIGIVTAAFGALSSYMSENTKEMGALKSGIEALNGSMEAMDKTLESISSKPFIEQLDVMSITAKSNAIGELSSGIKLIYKDLMKATEAASWWDKKWESISSMWGGDAVTKSINTVAAASTKALGALSGTEAESATKRLKDILGTDDLSASGLSKAIDGLSDPDKVSKIQELTIAISEIGDKAKKSSDSTNALNESFNKVSTQTKSFMTSISTLGAQATLGSSVIDSAILMTSELKNAESSVVSLQALLKDPYKLSILSDDTIEGLFKASTGMDDAMSKLAQLRQAQKTYQEGISKSKDKQAELLKGSPDRVTGKIRGLEEEVSYEKSLSAGAAEAGKLIAETEKGLPKLAESLAAIQLEVLDKGSKLISSALQESLEQASINLGKAAFSGVQGSGAGAIQESLRNREIGIKERQLAQELRMFDAVSKSETLMERANNARAIEIAQLESKSSNPVEAAKGTQTLNSIQEANRVLKLAEDITNKIIADTPKGSKRSTAFEVEVKKALSGKTPDVALAATLAKQQERYAAAEGKANALAGEQAISNMNAQLDKSNELHNSKLRVNEAAMVALSLEQKMLGIRASVTDAYVPSIFAEKKVLADKEKQLSLTKASLEYSKELASLNVRSKSTGYSVKTLKEEADTSYKANKSKIEEEARQTALNNILEESNKKFQAGEREISMLNAIAAKKVETANIGLSIDQAQLQAKQQLGTISSENYILESQALSERSIADESKIARTAEIVRIAELERKAAQEIAQAKVVNGEGTSAQLDLEKSVTDSLKSQKTLSYENLLNIEAQAAAKKKVLSIETATRLELDKQAKTMKLIDSIGDSLTKVFGKIASQFSNISKTLVTSNKEILRLEENKQAELEKIKGSTDKDIKDRKEVEMKYDRETAKVAMDSAANVAGAVAESFDERSKAAQVFHNIEKGFHIAKLVMTGIEIASDFMQTGTEVANAGTRSTAKGIEAIINSMRTLPPPFSFIAGAAMAAVVASVIGKSVGGGVSGGFTPSSDQLKETQGTGQTWNSKGEKVDTGFGVLGDSSAKSESIQKSLDFIKQYTFEEVEYSNKMLTALQSVTFSINGISRGVARTGGTLSGTGFGTNQLFNPSSLGSLPVIGKLLGSIFGGGTTSTVTGSGIRASGTIGSFASGATGVNQYETGTTTTKGGWFSSDKTNPFTNQKLIQDEAFNKAITDTFKGIGDSLVAAGSAIGLDSKQLADSIAQIPVNLSVETRGLKGSEISDAITAVLSNTADMVASSVLGIVKPFQQLNEGLAETAMRVGRTSQVIDLQLASVGMAFGSIGVDSIKARMALVDLAGGLEEFVSSSNFFKDNFLTEAERLAPVQKAVTDEMARLGFSAITTREGFKELVLSLNLSDEAQRKTYDSLMKVQKGFIAITPEVKKVATAAEIASAKLDMAAKALQVFGTNQQILAYTRKQELAAMDASLKPMQEWIYALEDEATAREELKNAYDAESSARQTTIDNLKSSIGSLEEFSKSLAQGENSPLTAGQKYGASKQSYDDLKAILFSPTSSDKDREKAANELQSTITTFLGNSKTFYASSEQYQKDYADAQATLALKIADSKAQLTIEEQSLNTQKNQLTLLGLINESVLSVSTAMSNLADATSKAVSTGQSAGQLSSTGAGQMGTGAGTTEVGALYGEKSDYIGTIVRGWYKNHPYIKGVGDSEGIAYWTGQILAGKSVTDVKTAFSDSASFVSGKTPAIDIQAFARGGYMKGLSLVGEQGPELVNFENPGQVYSNAQSGNLMGNLVESITAELVMLRKQVTLLEEANRKNTEAIIRGNYDANDKAANKVSDAVVNAAETENWNSNRNVVKMQ
jgi:hypothetical protein